STRTRRCASSATARTIEVTSPLAARLHPVSCRCCFKWSGCQSLLPPATLTGGPRPSCSTSSQVCWTRGACGTPPPRREPQQKDDLGAHATSSSHSRRAVTLHTRTLLGKRQEVLACPNRLQKPCSATGLICSRGQSPLRP